MITVATSVQYRGKAFYDHYILKDSLTNIIDVIEKVAVIFIIQIAV